jgi:hypothetical protein
LNKKTALDPKRITAIFEECLIQERECDGVTVECVRQVTFERTRLNRHIREIETLLNELPESFRGLGDSFLGASFDRHGHQWTGDQSVMLQLFTLGMAIGSVSCPVPKEMWEILPGEMPAFVVKLLRM